MKVRDCIPSILYTSENVKINECLLHDLHDSGSNFAVSVAAASKNIDQHDRGGSNCGKARRRRKKARYCILFEHDLDISNFVMECNQEGWEGSYAPGINIGWKAGQLL